MGPISWQPAFGPSSKLRSEIQSTNQTQDTYKGRVLLQVDYLRDAEVNLSGGTVP